jgi:very-short-patch-repair endonuclease
MGKHFLKYPQSSITRARRLRREMTDAERKLWSLLRDNQLGLKFRRQAPFGQYILDFLCIKAKLAVELDGGQHYTDSGRSRDVRRDQYLRSNGLNVLRFSDVEFLKNPDGVLEAITEHLTSSQKTR